MSAQGRAQVLSHSGDCVWLEMIVAALAFCNNWCDGTAGHWFMSECCSTTAANHLLMEHQGNRGTARTAAEGRGRFGADVKQWFISFTTPHGDL